MGKRILTAVILIPLILAIIYYLRIVFHILIPILQVAMLYEYFRAAGLSGEKGNLLLAALIPALLALFGLTYINISLLTAAILLVIVTIILWNLFRNPPERFLANCQMILFGVVYISFFSSMHGIIRPPAGYKFVYMLLFLTWACDSGAYFIGMAVGKKKIFPQLSPGKTVAGSIGGLVFALAVGVVCGKCFVTEISFIRVMGIAAVLGISTQLGDVIASGIKRATGVKDFGNLIPGHGGILDRLDSLILNSPVALLLLYF